LNMILAAAIVVASFGVRIRRLHAATQAINEARAFVRLADRLEEEVRILQRERQVQRSTIDLLLTVTQALPPGVLLSDLDVDARGNVMLTGRAASVEMASQAAASLEMTGKFGAARLERAAQEKEGLVFQIKCTGSPKGREREEKTVEQ